MKRVINITIGRIVFFIEEDAYETLSKYISSIREHFGSNEEGSEILEDIEANIAEKFQDKVSGSQPVTLAFVDEVIKEMGTVEDFKDFDAEPKDSRQESGGQKRLYRDTEDRIVGGVASGIGQYFNIDPLVPRIIFVVLAFANGFGVLAYILLWLIVPKATTTTQKLEMRGEAVTLSKVSEFVEKNIDRVRREHENRSDKKKLNSIVAKFQKALGKFFILVPKLFRVLFGLVLTLGGIIGIIALTVGSFASLIALPTISDPVLEIVLSTIFNPDTSGSIVVAIYFVAFIPLLTIAMGGISLLRKKSIFTTITTTFMVFVWTYSLVTALYFGAQNVPIIQEKIEAMELTENTTIEQDIDSLELLIDELETDIDSKITEINEGL